MKIGILTLQSGYNYGGSLQCEALQNTLIDLGHEVTILNYYPSVPEKVPFWRGWGVSQGNLVANIKRRLFELIHLGAYKQRYDDYKAVALKLGNPCFSGEDFELEAKGLDVVFVGSDQVWNLAYHPDPVYYLKFPRDFAGKKLSYAACCGRIPDECPKWIPDLLNDFDAISVRDDFTQDWVESLLGSDEKEIVEVADPTLLHDFKLSEASPVTLSDYILVYMIGSGSDDFHRSVIDKLRAIHGNLPVVLAMATGYKIQMFDWVDKTLWQLNPHDWAAWISKASFVYTDSFHGVLFSIKYQREFLAIYSEAIRAPRLINLAEQLDVGNRIIKSESQYIDAALNEGVNFTEVDHLIDSLVTESLGFIKRHTHI